MLFSGAPGKIPLPFAASGGKNSIPQPSQILITPGAASLTDGFPPLTRTLISAGGVPPSGLDMNGILYETTAIAQWLNAGAGYPFDSVFAGNSAVGGYPASARVARSDGLGYWLNTVDNNTTDPESSGSAAAGWFPDTTTGSAAITMTNANVTLTELQYGHPVIVITGTITTNLNLIFPAIVGQWVVINSTTGAYTITAKTASGTGVTVSGSSAIVGDGTNIYATTGTPVNNVFIGGTTNGSANAQVLASLTPASGFSLSNNGQTIICTAGYTNTTSATLAVTSPSISPTAIKKDSGSGLVNLAAGDITAGDTLYLTVNTGGSCLVLTAGLALGTAAAKAASDNTKSTVASVSGSTTAGHIASFADTAGTVVDNGVGTSITASLGADVALNNTANYFDGPSVAQGSSGTWLVTGTVTVTDTGGSDPFFAKLWDGTTVIASAAFSVTGANLNYSCALSGVITSPAGNLRISVRDTTDTAGKIVYNATGNSKDSTITAVRIG